MPSESEAKVQFQEITQPKSKATYVAEQIIAVIKRGTYEIGDRLPSERVIASQMNVSRNSVREALSALQILGILESRPGAGTYVCGPVIDNLDISRAVYLAKAGEDLLEIWEARKEIETSLIKLAINRATPKDLDEIEGILKQMREATRAKDSAGYLSANTKFHLAIATAADNLPLKDALRALMKITTQQLLEEINLGYVLESIEKSFKEHEDIFNAIRDRDEKAGTEAIKIHFEELEEYFAKKYQFQGGDN